MMVVIDTQEKSRIPPGQNFPQLREVAAPWGQGRVAVGSQAWHTLQPAESPPASNRGQGGCGDEAQRSLSVFQNNSSERVFPESSDSYVKDCVSPAKSDGPQK